MYLWKENTDVGFLMQVFITHVYKNIKYWRDAVMMESLITHAN